jgi:hypothetical protein
MDKVHAQGRRYLHPFLEIVHALGTRFRLRPWKLFVHRDAPFCIRQWNCA